MRNHDLVFLKHFSQVIGLLVAITLALILLGLYINSSQEYDPSPTADAATVERIRPVGGVYAGSTGAAAQAAAQAAAPWASVAYRWLALILRMGPPPASGRLAGSWRSG